MNSRILIHILALFGLSLLAACANNNADKDKEVAVEKDDRVPVEGKRLALGSIESVVLSSANLEAEASVSVYSRATNKVSELLVEEGDRVEAGQVLLRLEDDTQKLQLAKAQGRLAKANREYERASELFEKEFISQEDFNNSTYQLKVAELDYAQSKQELDYTVVTAPIRGTITKRLINLGDMVNNNHQVFDLVDFTSIVARVYLPEKNLLKLRVGQPARLSSQALGELNLAGHVKRIAPVVDGKTGTVKVTVAVDNTGPLKPGMYVDVVLVLAVNDQALLIPKRSLVYDNDQIFAFRIKRGGPRVVVERVLVEPQLQDENHVQALDGFALGDEIVVAGQTGLKEGAAVRVLGEADPEADRARSAAKDEEVAL